MRRNLGRVVAALGAALVVLGGVAGTGAANADTAGGGLPYVALGDSYSAGFGLDDYSDTSPAAAQMTDPVIPPGQSVAPMLNGCYQSLGNYPRQVAALFGFAIDDQTCSGAVTANITTTPQTTGIAELPATSSQTQTLPSVQGAALGPDTKVVTVTIGGNDLLFSAIAEDCVVLSEGSQPAALSDYWEGGVEGNPQPATCEQFYSAAPGTYVYVDPSTHVADPANANIDIVNPAYTNQLQDVVVPNLIATYAYIAEHAPNAQVFVIGYPQISPNGTTAPTCYAGLLDALDPPAPAAIPFNASDEIWLHGVEEGLDSAIRHLTAQQGANFHYVSEWDRSAQNTLCGPAEPWINGLKPVGSLDVDQCDATVQQLLVADDIGVCILLGALHPNAAGAADLATAVSEAITSTMPGLYLTGGEVRAGGQLTIAGIGFPPNATVQVTFHSTPVDLGTAQTTAAGAFTQTITIPADAQGDHEIVATSGSTSYRFAVSLPRVLPATGSADPTPLLALGLVVLLAGVALVALPRRRART